MSAKYKSPSFLLPNELNTSTNPSLSADRASNYSMDFDGTEYINAGRLLSSENTSTVSISFWLKIPSIGAKSYLGYWVHPNGWIIEADASSLYFAIGNTSYNALKLAYSGNISTNIWYHIAMVFDGTQTGNANRLKVYLNGTQKTLTTHSSSVIPSSIPSIPNAVVTIGGITPSTVNGAKSIDEVAIFNKALTDGTGGTVNQISSLYNSGSPASSATTINLGAIAYYPLGEQAQNTGYLTQEITNGWQFPNGVLQDYVIDFDGTSPGDAITNNNSGITGNAARTVSFWYNIGTSSSAMIPFSLGGINDTNSNSQFAYCVNRSNSSTTAAIFGRGGNDISPITVPATNDSQWHNVIITYTGSILALYIDGSNITLPSQPSAYATTDGFKIGGWSEAGNRLFNGKMSNVAIWNTAITNSAQIANIYNNGSPQTTYTVTPQNWWKLNADSVYTPSAPNYTKALSFDGTSDYISVPSSLPPSGTSNFAISGWFYRDSTSSTAAVYFDKVQGTNFLVREAGSSGTIEIFAGGTNYNYSSLSTYNTANAWHHIAISYDGSNLTVHVDTNKLSQSATGLNISSTSDMRIGARSNSHSASFFKGFISNVAVYNTNLTDSNVSTLFNFGTPETTPSFSPQAWWKLDDQTAITDYSNNGNTGTNNGATDISSGVAVTPSWKIPNALPVPTINTTSALDFSSGKIDISPTIDLDITTTNTISFWINLTSNTSQNYILSNNGTGTGAQRLTALAYVNIGASNAETAIYSFKEGYSTKSQNEGWRSTAVTNSDFSGSWHHVAIVRGIQNISYYYDGQPLGTGTLPAQSTATQLFVDCIGAGMTGSGTLNAKLSNLAIWKSDQSTNISNIYNNGQPQSSYTVTPDHLFKLDNLTTGINDVYSSSAGTATSGVTKVDTNVYVGNIPVNGVSTTLPSTALQQSDLQFDSPYSNYSLNLDGAGDYIDCGNSNILKPTTNFTLSTWVKAGAQNAFKYFYDNGAQNGGGFLLGNGSTSPNTDLRFWVNCGATGGSIIITANNVFDDNWHHIVATFDGSNMYLYKDGSQVATGVNSGSITYTTDNTWIGRMAPTNSGYFTAKIDEVALWNITLSESQILQVYNNGKPNNISSLSPVSWWRLGENAYFDNNSFIVPNSISGAPNGTGSGSITSMISADAPGTYANGIGTNLDIIDRVGDAALSASNSQSYNMIPSDISPYVPQYVGDQIANNFSMTFDGVNDYFDVPDIYNSIKTTNIFSISFWFKANSSSTSFAFGTDSTSYTNFGCWMQTNTGTLQVYRGGTAATASNVFSLNTWTHAVFVYKDTGTAPKKDIDIYINGSLVSAIQNGLSTPNINVNLTIGGNAGYRFNGSIDEFAIFDTALNAGQIYNDIYQPTATGTNQTADLANNPNLPTPVAWYRMGD